jgi:hypothetical protein
MSLLLEVVMKIDMLLLGSEIFQFLYFYYKFSFTLKYYFQISKKKKKKLFFFVINLKFNIFYFNFI